MLRVNQVVRTDLIAERISAAFPIRPDSEGLTRSVRAQRVGSREMRLKSHGRAFRTNGTSPAPRLVMCPLTIPCN